MKMFSFSVKTYVVGHAPKKHSLMALLLYDFVSDEDIVLNDEDRCSNSIINSHMLLIKIAYLP